MIPVKRDPLTVGKLCNPCRWTEVTLTLANKPQLSKICDVQQSCHGSYTFVIDNDLDFGQQIKANLGSWERTTQWKETLNIYSEGVIHKLATNLLSLIRSHHSPLNMHSKSIIRCDKLIMICGWIYNTNLFLEQISLSLSPASTLHSSTQLHNT